MAKPAIQYFVVLMLENRSFDHIFGYRKGVNGLSGTEFNVLDPSQPQGPTNPAIKVSNAELAATLWTVIVDGQPLRQTLSGWAMDNEMSSIQTLSLMLTTQPLKKTRTAKSDLRAAPPFEPPSILPENDHDTWRHYLDIFDKTKQTVDQIGQQLPGLEVIVQNDDARRAFVTSRLA